MLLGINTTMGQTDSTNNNQNPNESHFEARVSVGGGLSSFNTANSDGLNTQMKVSLFGDLSGYYFFNQNMGIGLGVGLSQYKIQTDYSNGMTVNNMVDIDGDEYTLHAYVDGSNSIKEMHTATTLDIPVYFTYRMPINAKWRLNASAGVKVGIPLGTDSELLNDINNVTLTTRGEYPQYGQPDFQNVYLYGFFEETNITGYATDDEYDYWDEISYSAVLDLSFAYPLNNSKGTELLIGGYFSYGINTFEPNKIEEVMINRDLSYNGALVGLTQSRPIQLGVKVGVGLGSPEHHYLSDEIPPMPTTLDSAALKQQDSIIQALYNLQENMSSELKAQAEVLEQTAAELEAQKERDSVQLILNQTIITFDRNSTELNEQGKKDLDQLVNLIIKYNLHLTIIGHTDEVGGENSNMKLSNNRAKAVYKYLISKGINRKTLTYIGSGKHTPMVPNASTDEDHAKNRRVEFRAS